MPVARTLLGIAMTTILCLAAHAFADSTGWSVSEGTPLPNPRGLQAAGVVNGEVVVAGGNNWNPERTVKSFYDETLVFKDGKWEAGPALPQPAAEVYHGTDGKSLVVAGGRRSLEDVNTAVQRLVERDGTLVWEKLTPLPQAMSTGTGAVLDGRFYVVGGLVDGKRETDEVWWLDLSKPDGPWTAAAPIPGGPRMLSALTAHDGALYLLGGLHVTTVDGKEHREIYRDVHCYDPAKNAWQRLADLPARGYAWAAAPIDDDHLLVAGRADGAIRDEVWSVNVRDGSTRTIGQLVQQSTCAPLVRAEENAWWLIGGEPDALKTRSARISVIARAK